MATMLAPQMGATLPIAGDAFAEPQAPPPPFGIAPDDAAALGKKILDDHRRIKEARRYRDLTAEKFMIHVDGGEGDGQWAEILDGEMVAIPMRFGGTLRLQRNLLRPLTDNFVSHFTSIPYRVVARPKNDKKARDRARIDTLFANHIIENQRLVEVWAEALYVAAVYGHCPVHAQWRDDLSYDPWEAVYGADVPDDLKAGLTRGFIDVWCGDPWSTVYNPGAKRNSVQWLSYDRTLPLELVQQAFAHVPGIESLTGRKDIPSASRFQRVAKNWSGALRSTSGSTQIADGRNENDELVAIVCREWAPGTLKDYPRGRLAIIAVNGVGAVDSAGRGARTGKALLLHDGPLPGGRFSCVRVYATGRFDDVLGKAYVSDLDPLQVELNQVATLATERLRRFARPQLIAEASSLEDDSMVTEDDAVVYVNGGRDPYFLTPPGQGVQEYETRMNEIEKQMFRIGGWQAASRGESNATDPAAKVVALARADDTIFGPIGQGVEHALIELLQTCHALAKEYMSVPWLVNVTGDEFGYMAESYLHASQMSDDVPDYSLVTGFGNTPEAKGQQLLSLVGMAGADGTPLLPTDRFWKLWPDASLRPDETTAAQTRERRAFAVNYAIQRGSDAATEELGEDLPPQIVEQLAMQVNEAVGVEHPLMRTDDPQFHLEVLDQIAQDPMANKVARRAAEMRQDLYFQWQEMIAANPAMAMQPPEVQQPQQQTATPGPQIPPNAASGMQAPADSGTTAAINPGSLAGDVHQLTNDAYTQ